MWPGAWVIVASGRQSMATAWGTHQPQLNDIAPEQGGVGPTTSAHIPAL